MEQVTIRAWGNSQGIRIPKDILNQLELGISDTLDISVQNDTIVLKKSFHHKTFEERLAANGGRVSVSEFDWGEPEGRELL